jgi:hypothetical protein
MDTVVQNLSTKSLKQKDHEFVASLGYIVSSKAAWGMGYIVRPCLKE